MEDKLMEIFLKSDDKDLFSHTYDSMNPKKKAETDIMANEAFKEMFDWDRKLNPNIVGEKGFEEYIKTINPELVRQRSKKTNAYIGTAIDVDHSIWETDFSKNLKKVLKKYDNNIEKMKDSILKVDQAMEYVQSGEMKKDTEQMNKKVMFDDAFDNMKKAEKDLDLYG